MWQEATRKRHEHSRHRATYAGYHALATNGTTRIDSAYAALQNRLSSDKNLQKRVLSPVVAMIQCKFGIFV
jgi:hypothetical protein